MEEKKPWQSKTVLVNILVALVPLIPQAEEILKDNPDVALWIVSALGIALRLITNGRVTIK